MKNTLILASMLAFSTFVSAEEAVVPESLIAVASENTVPVVSFKALDVSLDGFVSLDEVGDNEGLLESFIELDLDKSGDLSEVEFNKLTTIVE